MANMPVLILLLTLSVGCSMFDAVHIVSWLTCLIWLDIKQCYREVGLLVGLGKE